MARPRIFISSTFYDLRHVRADLETFIETLGYDTVRNEEGKIPYGKHDALEDYCYKEVENVDILISIIGGRFGSESKTNDSSISQQELKSALKLGKQVYIFIEKNVASEYETYLINKDKDLSYRYVDDKRIYNFIEDIKSLPANNNIKDFESSYEIVKYLKEQFAGLFQRFLQEQTRVKEVNLIRNLENTAKNLDQLVSYLREENKDKTTEINSILMINHPLVERLSELLVITYKFYIENYADLDNLLKARGFEEEPKDNDELLGSIYIWKRVNNNKEISLYVPTFIFETDNRLKFMKKPEWKEEYVSLVQVELADDNDDLPF
jgi:hypothetical protein